MFFGIPGFWVGFRASKTEKLLGKKNLKAPLLLETDFCTPPVLGSDALFDNSAPAVFLKIRVLRAQDFYTPLALNCQKGQHVLAVQVYEISLPFFPPLRRGGLETQILFCGHLDFP